MEGVCCKSCNFVFSVGMYLEITRPAVYLFPCCHVVCFFRAHDVTAKKKKNGVAVSFVHTPTVKKKSTRVDSKKKTARPPGDFLVFEPHFSQWKWKQVGNALQ